MRLVIVLLLLASTAHANPRVEAHLVNALTQLRARDVVHPKRAALIDELAAYIAAGEFPRRTGDPYGALRPRFIDDRGVHCAVGYLIARSGHGELAQAIDAAYEYAYVREMRSPALVAWAAEHGFTVDELAMIQPEYDGAPTAPSTRRQIEESTPKIFLECAAKHPPTREVTLNVVGPKDDYRPTVTTKSRNAFDVCFARGAAEAETGGGAYDSGPEGYRFAMTIALPTLQQFLDERLVRYTLPDHCSPRPGPLVTGATIAIATSETGLGVRVTTKPANAEVAGCLEKAVAQGFRDFAPIRTPVLATSYENIPSRLASVTEVASSVFRMHARACGGGKGGPNPTSGRVSGKAGDTAFAIEVASQDEALVRCVVERTQKSLREYASVPRETPDGTTEPYFRIDRSFQVSIPADRSGR